jgi:hypothetical protein
VALLDLNAPAVPQTPAPDEQPATPESERLRDLPAVLWMPDADPQDQDGEEGSVDEADDSDEAFDGGDEVLFEPGKHKDPDEDPDLDQRATTGWPRRALLKPDSQLATPLACYDHQGGLDPDRLRRWLQEHPAPAPPSPATIPAPPAAPSVSPFPPREGGGYPREAGVQVRSALHPAVETLPECGHRPHAPAQHPVPTPPTSPTVASTSPFPPREGGQGVRSALHPASETLPECGLQAAPSLAPAGEQPSEQGDEQGLDSTGTALPGTQKNADPGRTPTQVRLLAGFNGMSWEESLRTSPYCRGHAEWIIDLLHDHGFTASPPDP